VNRSWGKLPPMLDRTLGDDLRWAMCVLVGATVGYFLFGLDDPSVLVASAAGAVVAIVGLNVLRRMKPRRKP
jgi:hypothetical protein